MAITTAISAAPAWMTAWSHSVPASSSPSVSSRASVAVRQRYHGGVEFAGDVGRDGPDGAEVAPAGRHEDDGSKPCSSGDRQYDRTTSISVSGGTVTVPGNAM